MSELTLSALAAFLVCAAGNISNDILDLRIDSINRPGRVLVKGKLTVSFARQLALTCNLLALLVAGFVGLAATGFVAGAIVLLMAYNRYLKRVMLIGNIAVAVLGALIFITGAAVAGKGSVFQLPGPLLASVFAFLVHLVREPLKDIEDIDGDRAEGVVTLPQVIGTSRTLVLACVIWLLLVGTTFVPIIRHWYGSFYAVAVVLLFDLPLSAVMLWMMFSRTKRSVSVASASLKMAMPAGIVILVFAR